MFSINHLIFPSFSHHFIMENHHPPSPRSSPRAPPPKRHGRFRAPLGAAGPTAAAPHRGAVVPLGGGQALLGTVDPAGDLGLTMVENPHGLYPLVMSK
jgi:hypothetical protein